MTERRYGRRVVETSNEDKILFAAAGISKGRLIDYYEQVAPRILPHLRQRPLVLQRFPDGVDAEGFYQKQAGKHFPAWVDTVAVGVRGSGGHQDLVVCGSKATLGYLANQACIGLHPWLARRDRLDHPDQLVVDLDPPRGADFEAVRWAALQVRALLEDLGLACFPKLTGSTGIHVVVPLDRRAGFDAVRGFARAAMAELAARHPGELTTEQRKRRRRGRVYLDVGRNAYGQTAVAPWSVRPLAEAPIAVPLAWRDLEWSGIGPRDFTLANVVRRFARRGDPWAGMRRRARSLARAAQQLGG